MTNPFPSTSKARCTGRSSRATQFASMLAITLGLCAGAHANSPEPPDEAIASGKSTSTVNLTLSHQWLAGSTFHPIATPAPYTYPGNGCIQASASGERRFHHKLILPQGAEVKWMRLYYKNETSAAATPTAFFTTYNTSGSFNERSIVAGPQGTGHTSILSGEMSYVVDHFLEPINIVVNLGNVTDGSVQFCGVRIAYYAAEESSTLFSDGFE